VQSWVLLAIVVVAAFLVLGLSWISARWSRFGVSDIMIFVGLGPLLTSAASLIVVGTVSPHVLLLGTAFGGMAVLTLQVRQLENLFRAGRDSFRTFIGAFDFDQARWVVMGQTVFVGMLQVVIATQVFDRPILWLAFALALIPLYFLYVSVREAASPLSSNLVHIGRRAVFAQAVLLLWWGAAVWI
jgi:1,4-dihydroxy-2-naphthoate octaprenyltransferase